MRVIAKLKITVWHCPGKIYNIALDYRKCQLTGQTHDMGGKSTKPYGRHNIYIYRYREKSCALYNYVGSLRSPIIVVCGCYGSPFFQSFS